MRSLLLASLLTVALLSGCVAVQEDDPTADDVPADPPQQDPVVEPEAEPVEEAPEEPAAHGEPQVTEGPVTTGNDPQRFPGAWARRTITVTNDFGGAELGDLTASIASGSIRVQPGDQEGYVVEALVEARAATEAQAEDALARAHLEHTDVLEDGVLTLVSHVRMDPVENPTPVPLPVTFALGDSLHVDLVITVPSGPAIDLDADSSSGDVFATALHGPGLEAHTSSGGILLEAIHVADLDLGTSSGEILLQDVVAGSLEATTSSGDIGGDAVRADRATLSTSSGSITLAGEVATLEAGSSSGDLQFDLVPTDSGSYELSSSSGDIGVRVPADGVAYHADATTSSGDITVQLPDSEVLQEEERHVEVATEGFDDADLRTVIQASTSSGDIGIVAVGGEDDGDEEG